MTEQELELAYDGFQQWVLVHFEPADSGWYKLRRPFVESEVKQMLARAGFTNQNGTPLGLSDYGDGPGFYVTLEMVGPDGEKHNIIDSVLITPDGFMTYC